MDDLDKLFDGMTLRERLATAQVLSAVMAAHSATIAARPKGEVAFTMPAADMVKKGDENG